MVKGGRRQTGRAEGWGRSRMVTGKRVWPLLYKTHLGQATAQLYILVTDGQGRTREATVGVARARSGQVARIRGAHLKIGPDGRVQLTDGSFIRVRSQSHNQVQDRQSARGRDRRGLED